MKGLPTKTYGFSGISGFKTVGFCSNAPAGPSGELSSREHLLAVLAQVATWADIAVQGDARDPQFGTEVANFTVPIAHSGLGKADLRLAQTEFPSPFEGTSEIGA
jgi:hypothetical protein